MKKILKTFVILLTIGATSCVNTGDDGLNLSDSFTVKDTLESVEHEKANVILLYGQSNASGVSYNSCLEQVDKPVYDAYLKGYENAKINFNCENFANCSNEFVKTTLGQGCSKDHFGPEMGIAEKFENCGVDTFIIKYTYGGSILRTQWLKNYYERGSLYKRGMQMTKLSLDYLVSKGYDIDILGICWMQGEADASLNLTDYYRSTQSIVTHFREDLFGYDNNIKFVDAYILNDSSKWSGCEMINKAKLNFSQEGENNYLVNTISLGLTTANEPFGSPDTSHYDSTSMVKLGRAFADFLL